MDTSFTPDLFLEGLYGKLYSDPYKNVTTAHEARAVAEAIRLRLKALFNIDDIPGIHTPEVTYMQRDCDRGFFLQSKLSVSIADNLNMLCYLLEPKAKTASGVVALCGHGYGARQIINQGKNGKPRLIPFLDDYQKSFALKLVRNGNTVIVPELIGFGEAREKKDLRKPFYASSCEAVSSKLLMYGYTTASLRIYQAMCCVDILLSLENISADKIGCMGISGGGLTALYTGVLDERIGKIVISGYVNSFKTSVLNVWHCPDNFFPGVLRIGEIYDFACTLAPRRLLCECGERDKIFPSAGSHLAVERISRIYSLFGAQSCFEVDFFDGKHRISGTKSFTFFGE